MITGYSGNDTISSSTTYEYDNNFKKYFPKTIEHIAILERLNLKVDAAIAKEISRKKNLEDYFEKCKEELEVLKNTKLNESWVTFFNLLVDNKTKLIKYSENQVLINDFEERVKEFPI